MAFKQSHTFKTTNSITQSNQETMNLSLVDLKIDEIIDILLLHPEIEAPPENYRGLAEYLTKFKLQISQNSLESIFSMINTFEINRELLEERPKDTSEFSEYYEFFDESEDEGTTFYAIEDKVEELICMTKGFKGRRYKCLCIALIFHQNSLLQSQMPEWKTIGETDQPSTEEFIESEGSEEYWDGETDREEYNSLETQGMLNEMEYIKRQGEYSMLTPVEHRVVLGLIMRVI